MLSLTRKVGERIVVGDTTFITVVGISHGSVILGITSPPEVEIWREEIWIERNNPNGPKRKKMGGRIKNMKR